ncbi:hypothetical protein F4604DRAFT_1821861 [Suillus subluteus]|nr:hypothetical protein F4604DRAFT_1821861 [Suillus subluteus]
MPLLPVHPHTHTPRLSPAMSLAYVSLSLISLSFYFTDLNAFILVTFHILSCPSFAPPYLSISSARADVSTMQILTDAILYICFTHM